MRNLLLGAVALAATAFAAMPAAAADGDTIQFTLKSNFLPLKLFWELPVSPTPDVTDSEDAGYTPDYFTLTNGGPVFGGANVFGESGPAVFLGFTFYATSFGGGFTTGGTANLNMDPGPIGNFPFSIDTVGPQLFTGDTLHPTFKPGRYALYDYAGSCSCGGDTGDFAITPDYTLVIGTGGSAPEPAAWALMIAGFGLAGAALRRRTAAA